MTTYFATMAASKSRSRFTQRLDHSAAYDAKLILIRLLSSRIRAIGVASAQANAAERETPPHKRLWLATCEHARRDHEELVDRCSGCGVCGRQPGHHLHRLRTARAPARAHRGATRNSSEDGMD